MHGARALARCYSAPIRELSWGRIHSEFLRFALVPSPLDTHTGDQFGGMKIIVRELVLKPL